METRIQDGDAEDSYSSFSDDENYTLLDPLAADGTHLRSEGDRTSSKHAPDQSTLLYRFVSVPVAIWLALKSSLWHVTHIPRSSRLRSRARRARKILPWVLLALLTTSSLTWMVTVFSLPSFVNPPEHYQDLRKRSIETVELGRGNPAHEKVFIAVILHDPEGDLMSGSYSQHILDLIDLLGPDNVFLSVYESDSGELGEAALDEFRSKVTCDHEVVAEPIQPLDDIQIFTISNGNRVVRRIEYLATARNRALAPLNRPGATRYDKILYLNDVIFDPIEAAQLLFSTNVQEDGRAYYNAACAMDFKNPFIYYDTFATKDTEGYGLGVPFYPWFTGEGGSQSRRDVFRGTDHVRVKSCWGGMVAFHASFFQKDPNNDDNREIVRFRSEYEMDWEYSECCLIYADKELAMLSHSASDQSQSPGFYMNPFIRVAYSEKTFRWLPLLRKFERIILPIQILINHYVGLPSYNERRTVSPEDLLTKRLWAENNVTDSFLEPENWQWKEELAGPGKYCGIKATFILKIDQSVAKDTWERLPIDSIRT